MRSTLFIALALINDPEVVFLDELTTGLDPQARRAIWDLVRGIRERAKYVESLDPRYSGFARRLRSLAERFESEALLALVERYKANLERTLRLS